jgi:hypothetical protein
MKKKITIIFFFILYSLEKNIIFDSKVTPLPPRLLYMYSHWFYRHL